jgi:hypothetical protein
MPAMDDEWVVDYYKYTWGMLRRDLAERVNWGSKQDIVVSTIQKGKAEEMRLKNNMDLMIAMSDRFEERRLPLYVTVEDKVEWQLSRSLVTMEIDAV